MRRFLSILILILAGLMFVPAPTLAQGRGSSSDRIQSIQEQKREWGEMLVLGLIAGGIGLTVLLKGTREFIACLPKRRRPYPDESRF